MRLSSIVTVMLLASVSACKPPAADEYVERVAAGTPRGEPSAPIASPDTAGAVWADSDRPLRLVYGKPGSTPLLALACEKSAQGPMIHITRFVAADPGAQALIALIGNGHMARLPVDAVWNGRVWLWEGRYPADHPELDVLTGPRPVEVTLPGAGTTILNASERPTALIDGCRLAAEPVAEPSQQPVPG